VELFIFEKKDLRFYFTMDFEVLLPETNFPQATIRSGALLTGEIPLAETDSKWFFRQPYELRIDTLKLSIYYRYINSFIYFFLLL
jgi:hypothetical protein